MAVLAIVGITGMYLRQVEEMGVLGLIGYLLFGAFFLPGHGRSRFVEAFVLPAAGRRGAAVRQRRARALHRRRHRGDLGAAEGDQTRSRPCTYLFGGLLFGIALYRARVLARWAALLLAAGSVAALATCRAPALAGPDGRVPRRPRPGRARLFAHA